MKPTIKDLGALQALIHRFTTQRLQRLLKIKKSLDHRNKLSSSDLEFLHLMLKTASQVKPLFDRHPDFQDFYTRVVGLLHEITTQALANEIANDSIHKMASREPSPLSGMNRGMQH
ncbi:MAG: hypothetical protein ACKN9W_11230 [Methylococcus sp.]